MGERGRVKTKMWGRNTERERGGEGRDQVGEVWRQYVDTDLGTFFNKFWTTRLKVSIFLSTCRMTACTGLLDTNLV